MDGSDLLGRSALHEAVSQGELETARTLILYGAEVDAADLSGQTPLYFASELGKVDMVSMLLEVSIEEL